MALVHIVDDVPELEEVDRPVLMVALDGFLDAGTAAALAMEHLASLADSRVVATFDVDALYDYRARRPPLSFVRDHYASYEAPRLVVRVQRDTGGTPYLVLRGPEPDIRWEGFCAAVREVVERFDVDRVIGLGAVPMAVPHTRPTAITHHANDPALLVGESVWQGELRIPSSAQALLELRLGEWGHPALGFVAHIPHYLAQTAYPQAAVELLELVERAGRLTLDLSELRAAAERTEGEIAAHLEDNAEVAEVVRGLEAQYDTFHRAQAEGRSLLAPDEPIPTGEEIGRQFEQFLAGLDGPEGPEGSDAGPADGRPE